MEEERREQRLVPEPEKCGSGGVSCEELDEEMLNLSVTTVI